MASNKATNGFLDAFHAFAAAHPAQRFAAGGVEWEYITAGTGSTVVLLLPGGLARPEAAHSIIEGLAPHFRVLAPAYPPVSRMDEVVDGLCALLDREGLERVHVIGGSYGGMVAQCMLERRPDRIRRLVLMHTGPPKPERIARVERTMRILHYLPASLLRWMLRTRFRRLVVPTMKRTGKGDPDRLGALIDYMTREMTRADILVAMQRVGDFYANYGREPVSEAVLREGILIIESDDDPAVPAPDCERLRRRFQGAKVQTYRGAGHVSSVVYRDEFLALLRDFLRGE